MGKEVKDSCCLYHDVETMNFFAETCFKTEKNRDSGRGG